jgi:hypothetical protein
VRKSGLPRRKLIFDSLAFAGTSSSLLRLPVNAATTLPPTPRQTPGTVYPMSFPQDADNDLIHVAGHQRRLRARPRGSPGIFSTRTDDLFPAHAWRFGNVTRTCPGQEEASVSNKWRFLRFLPALTDHLSPIVSKASAVATGVKKIYQTPKRPTRWQAARLILRDNEGRQERLPAICRPTAALVHLM